MLKYLIMFLNLLETWQSFTFFKKKDNIWKKIKAGKKEGIFVLAPMLDVTDKPFRDIVSRYRSPDLFFTEFVSVDGLCSREGRKRLMIMFEKTEHEKKNNNLIFQIFGSDPKKFKKAVKIIKKLNPAGIDINTGCPDKAVIKQGSGSALMKDENWEKTKDIFETTRKEAGNIPVSIKTRIGFHKINLDWIKFLLSLKPETLTIHLRTTKEASKVDAHWELAQEINRMRNEISPETILIGNGDIETKEESEKKIKESGFDGVMIGRGIFHNPILFSGENFYDLSIEKRFEIMILHLDLFHEEFYLGNNRYLKSLSTMKKFLKIYINGFDGAKELRVKLMEVKTIEEIKNISQNFLKKIKNKN